ncbi:MAG: hypothetical protein CVU10_02825 [Bacteroidetes bacterium HGW-Bacteroidetes-5]|nr:MAG: hypothetical protein CVU10_02825 [Bacteroidetes bacterium HGW-Bacteroidetes-5]
MEVYITNLLKTSFMSNERKFEIRSDEVNDILSRPPSWMVRIGSIIMASVLSLILIGAAFFRYPDIIKAPIVITSENLPAQLVAKRSGRIQSIFPDNGEYIKRGEVIAILENPGSFQDYQKVREICTNYLNLSSPLPEKLLLGELQGTYSQFVKSLKEYRTFISLDYHRKMINSVRQETEAKRGQLKIAQRKEAMAIDQYEIAQNLFDREKSLFDQKAISQQDFDRSRSSYLAAGQQLESAREELNRNRVEVIKGEQSILDLEMEREEGYNRLKRAVEADLDILMSQLGEWEQLNLFISPVDGVISFTSYWQENQNVHSGDIVFTVLPEKEKKISGKLFIPMAGAGKVRPGQKVNVKLDSYPYMEFGMVQVEVKNISLLPANIGNERVYIVGVEFPEGLRTNYSLDLNFSEEMHGVGEIITDNASVLKRILYPVRHMIKNNF